MFRLFVENKFVLFHKHFGKLYAFSASWTSNISNIKKEMILQALKLRFIQKYPRLAKKSQFCCSNPNSSIHSVCPWTPPPLHSTSFTRSPPYPPQRPAKNAPLTHCALTHHSHSHSQPAAIVEGEKKLCFVVGGRGTEAEGKINQLSVRRKFLAKNKKTRKGGGKATHSSALERSWQRWDFLITPLWKKMFSFPRKDGRGRKCGLLKWVRRRWLTEKKIVRVFLFKTLFKLFWCFSGTFKKPPFFRG